MSTSYGGNPTGIAGTHYGGPGLGVLGADVPSSGAHGAALLFNDISLPAEATDEFRALILTVPAAGALFVYEDSSLSFSGPDGVHTGTYEGYKNGLSYGVAAYSITLGNIGPPPPPPPPPPVSASLAGLRPFELLRGVT